MDAYLPRLQDAVLTHRLEASGAVLVEGPKWCGKTRMSLRQARSVIYLQDPDMRQRYLAMAQTQMSTLLEGDVPRLLDEWQEIPELWDAVRFAVDRRQTQGQFILTGSATPPDFSRIRHSGAGRIARLRLRPMSLFESGDSDGSVSLGALFDGERVSPSIDSAGVDELAFLCVRGGWPSAVTAKRERVALSQADFYLEAVVEAGISDGDGVRRDPDLARAILRSYARGLSSQMRETTLFEDLEASGFARSHTTVRAYLKALRDIFVLDDLIAWNPNLRSKTAIRTAPTRHFADPSIACAALELGVGDLVGDPNTFGLIFEDLCVRDLRVYVDALRGGVYHYRDRSGLECDAVVRLHDGRYGLVEVKLGGPDRVAEGERTLLRLKAKIDAATTGEPAFMMVLTGTNTGCYTLESGVHVVPVQKLGV